MSQTKAEQLQKFAEDQKDRISDSMIENTAENFRALEYEGKLKFT